MYLRKHIQIKATMEADVSVTETHNGTLATALVPTEGPFSIVTFAPRRADPVVVLEASLTSVKYACYHFLGHIFFQHSRALFSESQTVASQTLFKTTCSGFVGGALLTLPFLAILAMKNDSPNSEYEEAHFELTLHCFVLLGIEMFYSAIAGGLGMLVLNGWDTRSFGEGFLHGFGSPFISYAFLSSLLNIILSLVSFIARYRVQLKSA